ncbi:hypothetical protein L873DRAFT_1785946 [Choiromyces venosus 120613-1]|uniref:Uncharacterized protein n=1 Tax=Choiromyces venosus 120613-1 TaxID=1336337 RepID=A0A3N4K348_9PEZI|nr:hypothetical protein L873DRAFT_1785946 [Choiromyces venosus 120613-1]
MADDTQCRLHPQPPRKGRKHQIIHSSPEINDEPAEAICIRTPECLKASQCPKTPAPNQPLFQPPSNRFDFSPPQASQNTRDTSTQSPNPYTVIPGYKEIEYCEPQDFTQHKNMNYHIVFHANMLVKEALNTYSEESESDLAGQITESMEEKNLLHQVRRILDQFLFKVNHLEMVENTEIEANTKVQTPLIERIECLETKIDSLLFRNLSYSSVL